MPLAAYFDESGTNPHDPALSIAGFISDDERWRMLSDKWGKAMMEWGIPFWHMADYEARREQFESWPRDETSQKRFDYLLSLITDYTLASISVTFPRDLFRSYIEPKPHPEAALYLVTVTFALLETYIYSQQRRMTGAMALVFEQGARGRHEVQQSYDSLPAGVTDHFNFVSLTFARKTDFEGLQTADIFAYEQFRQYPKVHGNDTRAVRYPLKRIFARIPHSGGVIHTENLDEVFAILGDQL